MSGQLIVVGTPIGNLGDMSPRAVEALENCDFIAAEDTRVTLRLLNHFGIKKPLVSYYEHNRREKGEYILSRILGGETCVLVSDAGMPAISDPGEELVAGCAEADVPITAVPGPTAVITGLALSGLPTGRFTFEGFLSTNKRVRREHLESLKNETRTMIFYEAPHKLLATLDDFCEAFGNRRVSFARELTKLHEEMIRTTLSEARERFRETPPRGEFVIILAGAEPAAAREYTAEEAEELARSYLEEGMSASEAAKRAAKESGRKKGEIYASLVREK